MDKDDFQTVIRTLEEEPVMTEEVYDLENIKHVYGGEEYNKVMSEVYDENYDAAIELLDQFEQEREEERGGGQ